ncbi:hypothetical protein LTR66_006585 [Elasticomyces elasticus]|nr:hypothetical protein LTR66_006585 [Elasticomyces elasticus]
MADFPPSVTLSITLPPASQPATNILLLLHGLGDTNESFKTLGQQMALPETACISIRGPKPLPFDLGGFHWSDDLLFDQSGGEMDGDAGFTAATKLIAEDVVKTALVEKCGYTHREIIVFGFGQGAMAALSAAREFPEHRGLTCAYRTDCIAVSINSTTSSTHLGGVISIGGPLPKEAPASLKPKCRTPVLTCCGSSNSTVTASAEEKLKNVFEFVEIKRYRRSGDSMPRSRDEMLPIMQFFARGLKSTQGVRGGAVEVG